jgi:hypothetical protein
VVVCHYNGGSIVNRDVLDTLYAENNVLLHLSGHWENVQHWRGGITDYVMDSGCRKLSVSPTFSVIHFGRDRLTLAHYQTFTDTWHAEIIDRPIAARWPLSEVATGP